MDAISYVMIGIICILIIALFILLKQLLSPKHKDIEKIRNKQTGLNILLFLYEFFRDTPILSKYLGKIRGKVQILYPADTFAVVKYTSNILLKICLATIAGVLVTLFISQGDIFFICSGLLITFVALNIVVDSSFQRMEDKILEQFANFLSSMRHKYHDVKIVETAIANTMDDLPYEISLHIQNIYDIIIDPNMRYRIDQYVGVAPNKYMLMFLSVCASVKEYGDKAMEDGSSLFLEDLNYLKEEVNNERLARDKKKNAFSCLTGLSLFPVLGIKPLEMWAKAEMEEIAQFYDGMYGTVAMIAIFVCSFVVYNLIVALKDKEVEVEKENDIFARLSKLPILSSILNKMVAKHYMKYEEYNNDLHSLGNHTGPKAFLLKRIILGVATFIIAMTVLSGTVLTSKIALVKDFAEAFNDIVVPNQEYTQIMIDMAESYSNTYILEAEAVTIEELTSDIQSKSGLKSSYSQAIAKEILERQETYKNSYFKWYYLILSLILSVVAYMAPVAMLWFKRNLIDMRKQEEIIQFQSLMLILMHMDGMTVETILEWMERFAYCFKEDIAECRVNLFHGEKEALLTLRDSQRYEQFRDFVENLLSIDRVGVVAAFDEIKTDRDFYKENRKEQNERNIQKKSSTAQMLAFIPLGTTVGLYLIIPIFMYALSMLSELSVMIG